MSQHLLSKTDFKIARQCPTKLFYAKNNYRSTNEEDEYMELLKEGGHVVGEIARIIHPAGIFIGLGSNVEVSARETEKALQAESVTLFEAVFVHDGMLVVADIVEKRGDQLSLIEVKSKSYDSTVEDQIVGKKGVVRADWLEYIDDIAFQTVVVRRVLPKLSVTPYLLMPDKSKKTEIESLASMFQLEKTKIGEREIFRVNFTGDVKSLVKGHFLTKVNVEEPVKCIFPLVEQEANRFVKLLQPELTRAEPVLGKHCKGCEFDSGEKDCGYKECWKELADVTPHIFDLYHGGSLKVDGKFLLDKLISERKVSLFDVPESAIKGKRGERQSVQVNCTRTKTEWVSPLFGETLRNVQYPLHFVDFETSTSAIPYHKGMRPYEQIAFQWSCHTVESPGDVPVHSEWINLKDAFPSFDFAETLRNKLSKNGTILTWAEHENRVLKDIRRQAVEYDYKNGAELCRWIDTLVVENESRGQLVDMNALCLEHYFHPEMKGKTSIKYVLPAIWNNNDYLWDLSYFKQYLIKGEQGEVLSPYDTLTEIKIGETSHVVRAGTGAMQAYQEMMYGLSRSDTEIKERWSKLLLQYCCLDTMAMLIIWTHWNKLVA